MNNGFNSRTQFAEIHAFSTKQIMYYFYFPSLPNNENFESFPIIVSKKGNIVTFSQTEVLKVIDRTMDDTIELNTQ